MWLVTAALRRPITVLVLVIAAVFTGLLAIERMPRDVFPNLGVPVLYVAQPYGGMDPAQMEGFLVNYYEYHFLYITGIEHVESKSIQGVALIKLQFHPGTDMAGAMAETVNYVNRARAFMPTGTVSPFVMRFDAGSVPVGDLVFSDESGKLGVKELQDAALFRVRPLFATLPGVSAPPPFGGSPRSIVISADPDRLRAYNMSPDEIVQAITKGNTISPSGNVRFGNEMPMVPVNSVVTDVRRLGDVPIRSDGTRTIFVRDIGTVADSADIEFGYALVNGHRTVYVPVTKRADASTLSVVNLVKENAGAPPPGVKVAVRGQVVPMEDLFYGLKLGLIVAVIANFLLLAANFQSFRLSLAIILTIPAVVAGVAVALWVTRTTLNIESLIGAIMAIGVAVANAILLVTFAERNRIGGAPVPDAAVDGAASRLRPILMTSCAMIAGMLPIAVGLGEAASLMPPDRGGSDALD